MRVFGEVNNISDELKAKIVPLKPGQFAEYQLLEIRTATDPETGKKWKRYPHNALWAHDTIYDAAKGVPVEIGVVAQNGYDMRNKVVTMYEQFEFDNPLNGILILNGDKILDRELHEFMQLSNKCGEGVLGEDRDPSIELIYKLIDRKKEARVKSKAFDAKADALIYVRNMDVAEARDFAAAMNWEYQGDPEEIMGRIREWADEHPLEFTAVLNDPLTKKKSIIKRAMGTVITYDAANHRILWKTGNHVIAQLERKQGVDEVHLFAEWLNTATNGDKILGQLRNAKNLKSPAAAAA